MEKTAIKVDGMSCEHCIASITKGVEALPGIASVEVSLADKSVVVEYDSGKTTLNKIKGEIEKQGYDVL
jgi:copper chaperone